MKEDELEKTEKRMRFLLKKYKRARKTKYTLTTFQEPVMILIRRNKTVEFHEPEKKNKLK